MSAIEPTTEIDRQIADAWPQRWAQANEIDPRRQSNAKRRNRLRREWAKHCYEESKK